MAPVLLSNIAYPNSDPAVFYNSFQHLCTSYKHPASG